MGQRELPHRADREPAVKLFSSLPKGLRVPQWRALSTPAAPEITLPSAGAAADPDGPAGARNDSAFDATAAAPASIEPASESRDAETVLILVDIAPSSRAWGLQRYVLGAWPLRGIEGLRLVKVLGSGHDGGFGLRPSGTRQGLLCLFDTSAQAASFLYRSTLADEYRAHAREFFSVRLRAYSCRGSWSGVSIPVVEPSPEAGGRGPIAALTRASIRPRSATQFWKMAPATQSGLEAAHGCRLAVGLGEAPLLRQATFSLWESPTDMDRYARAGPHLAAIQTAHQQDFFSESMFVRFVPREADGTWKGRRYPQSLAPQAGEPPLFAQTDPLRDTVDGREAAGRLPPGLTRGPIPTGRSAA
jgi:hypothetical protein